MTQSCWQQAYFIKWHTVKIPESWIITLSIPNVYPALNIFDVEGDFKQYEPGDVLIISQSSDRTVEKSSTPYSNLIAGLYTTKPGVLLTDKNANQDVLDLMVRWE